MTHITALDLGWATTREAEHEALRIASAAGLPVLSACTHFAADPPRVVVTLETPAPPPAGIAAPAGGPAGPFVDAHRGRRSGRAFVFAGADAVAAQTTLARLVAATGVDRVAAPGGQEPPAGTVLRTQAFLRPEFVDGALVLRVRPADGGAVVPFEQPRPTPCCADH